MRHAPTSSCSGRLLLLRVACPSPCVPPPMHEAAASARLGRRAQRAAGRGVLSPQDSSLRDDAASGTGGVLIAEDNGPTQKARSRALAAQPASEFVDQPIARVGAEPPPETAHPPPETAQPPPGTAQPPPGTPGASPRQQQGRSRARPAQPASPVARFQLAARRPLRRSCSGSWRAAMRA